VTIQVFCSRIRINGAIECYWRRNAKTPSASLFQPSHNEELKMIEASFVASWWLMLCVICAMCMIMFLDKMGISIGSKDAKEDKS
jgi:hypothetical protein